MGGSDQWGNILTGTELIRRKAGGEAFAFTCRSLQKQMAANSAKQKKEMYGLMQKKHRLTSSTSSG
jgi:tyrosyl-tRNA synthetase